MTSTSTKSFPPTVQQQAAIDALLNTTTHLCMQARAGTGKTSTILLMVQAYAKQNPFHEVVVCAYNKAIADEVKEKLANLGFNWKMVQASTIHALGFGLVKFVFKSKIDDKKVQLIIDDIKERGSNHLDHSQVQVLQQYGAQVAKLVRVAKQAGVGFFNDSPIGDVGVWHQLADHFDINGFDDTSVIDGVVALAQEVYKASLIQTDVIDFDDMILFPLIKNLRVKFTKDLIFLDEAQDLSRSRQALAKKFLSPGTGRMVIVGDDRQAIYGFSGADAAALDNLVSSMAATVLPLSVTWRCPKAVVKLAQTIVPDIEAAPGAIEGEVLELDSLPDDVKVGDAILCRNTAPLIKIAHQLIRRRVACKVEGRDVGEQLSNLVGRWKVKTIDALLNRVEDYRAREMQKAVAKGNEQKAESVSDRCDTIVEICSAVTQQGGTSVQDVRDFIESIFADGAKGVVVLATYHRSKGREWQRVVLWEHSTRCPSRAAKQAWQKAQEQNLAYVAFTRAQHTLAFVN